jgi:hypothetical protein
MKIAYVSTYDSSDIHAWSGLINYILRALQSTGIQTVSIGNLQDMHVMPMIKKFITQAYCQDSI